MTYDVLDISRYIINKSIEIGNPINNLKLQKLLYYVQAEFLVKKGEQAFNEDIVAWKYGPVIVEAYDEFKGFFSEYITNPILIKTEEILNDDWEFERVEKNVNPEEIIKKEDAEIIKDVILEKRDKSAVDIMIDTHKEYPWINNYDKTTTKNIPIEDIKNYFKNKKNGEI